MNSNHPNGAPRSVRILGKVYEVRFYDAEATPHISWGLAGAQDNATQSIVLDPKQAPEQMRDTLLHEILHCLDYTVQLKLTEPQIHALSGVLYALMAENPGLHRWLFDPVQRVPPFGEAMEVIDRRNHGD